MKMFRTKVRFAPVFVFVEPVFDFIGAVPVKYLRRALSDGATVGMDVLMVALGWNDLTGETKL